MKFFSTAVFSFSILCFIAGCASNEPADIIAAGNAYLDKGYFDDAIYEYSRLLENNPNDAYAYLLIGKTHLAEFKTAPDRKGESAALYLKEAAESFKKADDFITAEEASYVKDIEAYKLKGESSKANVLQQHLDINMRILHADILVCLGDMAFDNGSFLDAVLLYEKAANLSAFNLKIRFKYALAAEEIPGAEKEAVELWEVFLELAKNNSALREKYDIMGSHLQRAEQGIRTLDKRIEDAFAKEKNP